MFLSNLSIKRPVFAAVMMLALVTLGAFSYKRLAVDMYPDVEIPFLLITTKFPGASPETVEREVTRRVEEAVNPIAGVKHVNSQSREGVSLVFVEFQLEVKVNDAAQEARTKIGKVRGQLPQGIEEPIIEKFEFGSLPIVSLAMESKSLTARELSTLVDKRFRRRIENLSGVGRLDVVGPTTREVNVDVRPDRLQALGMGVDELMNGLAAENVNVPVGRVDHGSVEQPMRVAGRPKQVEGFESMAVVARGGVPIRLADVADVKDGVEERRSLAFVDGRPAVALDVIKQSGANTVAVVDRVFKEVETIRGELPQGTTIQVVRDSSGPIRDSVRDVQETMVIGALLTVLIVFLFLNSWRSTVITGLTLPISVVSSFIVMNFMGMTLNTMTLMALSLAIGLLIDDAIVVRENIVRHLEKGADHFTAAREGTAEIGLAVLATTFSIIAVFVPVAFMKGIIGRFFYQFGITVAFAVLVSLFVSFTLDPMLSSRWIDPDIERTGRKRSWFARRLDRFNDWFDRTADRYKAVIAWALDHRWTVVGAAFLAFLAGIVGIASLQTEFFPRWDAGEFGLSFVTAPDASIDETAGRMKLVLRHLKTLPEVERTYASIGAGDSGTVRDATIYVKMVPKGKRKVTQAQFQTQLRQWLGGLPGVQASVSDSADQFSQKPLQLLIRGEEIDQLKAIAAKVKRELYKVPGVVDMDVTLEQDIPEFKLAVDRERAARVGADSGAVVRALSALVGGQVVSTYEDEDGDAVDVRVRLPLDLRGDIEHVRDLRLAVRGADGKAALVPIGELTSYERAATPSQIDRRDLRRQVVISANLEGVVLGPAVENAMKAASKIQLPPGYSIVPAGDVEMMTESFGYMVEALLLAVILVYLILAAQFESFLDPLSIMLSLPLSIVGLAAALLITGDTLNMMSLIGLIMLMGLVTKNAILLIDFAKHLRAQGMSRRDALIEAGRIRLRPIMMTTLAMIGGMLPLALALGAGAEVRAPLARAVIGGLVTSTLLTLIVVPVFYTLLDDLAGLRRRKRAAAEETIA
ncbi:efflux RND transporter permease subunit [bacterium]|nr:efflux RND transporter permease subunit [bacterium]